MSSCRSFIDSPSIALVIKSVIDTHCGSLTCSECLTLSNFDVRVGLWSSSTTCSVPERGRGRAFANGD